MPLLTTQSAKGYGFSSLVASTSSFDSIQTVTVGSGGQASISFTSIPSTYKHLQIRVFAQCNRGTVGVDALKFTFNGVGGTSYTTHQLRGDGANPAVANADNNQPLMAAGRTVGTSAGGSFGVAIIDILDYASTVKYKTAKTLGGVDVNGTVGSVGGAISFNSGLFMDTSNPISSVVFTPDGGTAFNQHSSFALYGIR
jgi:hypothetical protein